MSGTPAPDPRRERQAERLVLSLFGLTVLSGLALFALYLVGGQPQLEGVLLTVCLGTLGAGIIVWSKRLMDEEIVEEERHPLGSADAEHELAQALTAEGGFSRRTVLIRALLAAFAGLGAALILPVLSLGPAPGRELFTTPWQRGRRLVKADGQAVRAQDLVVGSIVTVFPEGFPGSADGQTLLIHVEPELLQLPPDRMAQAPQGYVAYSKVCTHAGCPVGLYRAEQHRLICPCHQSTFDVLDGARPTYGPAVRPLPQLPIQLEPDGTFTALGDFPEPIGPSFWNVHG